MGVPETEIPREVRPSETAPKQRKGRKGSGRVHDAGSEGKVAEPPAPAPVAFSLRYEGREIEHLELALHADTPLFVPGSSTINKQLNVYRNQGTGRWTRPTILAEAKSIDLTGGALTVVWRNNMISVINSSAIASFSVESTG